MASASAGILTTTLLPVLNNSRSQGVILQRDSAVLEYDVDQLPASVSLDGMPEMMLVGTLATVAEEIMSPGWTEVITGADCLEDIADTCGRCPAPAGRRPRTPPGTACTV